MLCTTSCCYGKNFHNGPHKSKVFYLNTVIFLKYFLSSVQMIPWTEKEKDKEKNKIGAPLRHATYTVIFEEHVYAQSRNKIPQKYQDT